jgi:succinyl-CoA synthetase beta subunit
MDLGQAHHEKIRDAFILMETNKYVGAIYINVFLGLLSGEKLALVIGRCFKDKMLTKPVVIRMKGFGSEEGNKYVKQL